MSALLGKLMANARKAEIGFGIHANVVITSVDNDQRKTKEGEKIKRNCYTTFSQLNEDGVIVAEKEISWFNLDPSSEYVYNNFIAQLEQMTAIVDLYYNNSKKDKWQDVFSEILEKYEIDEGDEDDAGSVETLKKSLEEAMKNKDICNDFMDDLGDAYVKLISKKCGEDSASLRLKIVYDYKGKYLQAPRYGAFVELMDTPEEDTILKITDNDLANKEKSLVTNNTSAPGKGMGNL